METTQDKRKPKRWNALQKRNKKNKKKLKQLRKKSQKHNLFSLLLPQRHQPQKERNPNHLLLRVHQLR